MLDAEENRLLIVEDDQAFRDRLAEAMCKRGFEVTTAASLNDAKRAIAQFKPKFVVLDLQLPDGNGLGLVDRISSHNPAARIIILTGYGNITEAVFATRHGVVDFMAKPAAADEIAAVFRTPLGETPPQTTPIHPEEAKREHIERVLHEVGDNITHAAKSLKMHRRTLQRVLKRGELSGGA